MCLRCSARMRCASPHAVQPWTACCAADACARYNAVSVVVRAAPCAAAAAASVSSHAPHARPATQHVRIGRIAGRLSDDVFVVDFGASGALSIGVDARVHVAYTHGEGGEQTTMLIGGTVIRDNADATLTVLLNSGQIDIAVPRHNVVCVDRHCGTATPIATAAAYRQLVEWVSSAGIATPSEQHCTARVLYYRGWRADKLYLLEEADVSMLSHLSRCSRLSLLEKAQWQRDHHRQMRSIYKERVKERDVRYLVAKYAGIISATVAFLGASSLFGWNYKNYCEQQRHYQLRIALRAMHNKTQNEHRNSKRHRSIGRDREEQWMRQVLRKLDAAHPRIVVLTGFAGCGKSTVCRAAIAKEGASAVHVDVYGADSALRGVVKALGVQNVDACGDLLDFVTEACQQYTAASGGGGGTMPLLVLKLREGSDFRRVYDEAVTLACGHKACHVIIEVPLESLTMADVALPRLDFYAVPNFSEAQAYAYTEHSIDPVAMHHFVRVAGTNSNDLDELYAAVHHRKMSATEYTSRKLVKAMRQVQAACAEQPRVRAALTQLAAFAFDEGQHAGVDAASLASAAVRDIVLYDPVRDRWLFRNTTLHTAVRCCA